VYFQDWQELPMQDIIINTEDIKTLKKLHNKVYENLKLLQIVIIEKMYLENGFPNYEVVPKVVEYKNQLLDKTIDLITAFDIYIKLKIKEDEKDQIATLILYSNRLREIAGKISNAESESFKNIVTIHLKKINSKQKEYEKSLEETYKLNEMALDSFKRTR